MSTFGPKLSKAGSVASLICAVHCAVTPLALLALPVIAAHSWDGLDRVLGVFWAGTTEWVFVAVIALLAGFGLLATYPRHWDIRPTVLTVLGLFVLTVSHLWVEAGSGKEIFLDVLGASLIAWAGFWNRRLCHQLGCHTHEHAQESASPKIEPIPDLSSNP
jgi:hypothetical protein